MEVFEKFPGHKTWTVCESVPEHETGAVCRQVLQRKRELFEEVSKGIKLAVYNSVLTHKTDCLEMCPTEMVLGIKIWAAYKYFTFTCPQ